MNLFNPNNNDKITHNIDSIGFDLYKSEEIRKMSIKQITESTAFDTLGRPIIGGVHDPALGVSPYDKTMICNTCSLDSTDCPGHFGHIELPACVYNPFVIGNLNKLLNGKCFNCHKLRMRDRDKKYYFLKILLIKLGLVSEANNIYELVYSSLSKESDYKQLDSIIGKFIRSLSYGLTVYQEDISNFSNLNIIDSLNNKNNSNINNNENTFTANSLNTTDI